MKKSKKEQYQGYLDRLKRKEKRELRKSSLDDRISKFKNDGISVSKIHHAYIYLIENAIHVNWYKLGTTVDLNNRLSTYQTCDPFRNFTVKKEWIVLERFQFEKMFLEYAERSSIFEVRGEWIYTEDHRVLIKKIDSWISSKKHLRV